MCVCVCVPVSTCTSDTESLEGVGHGLVLHHVDESSSQTEVGEDQEDVLQDVVDASDFLQKRLDRVHIRTGLGRRVSVVTHIVAKQLHDEGGDAPVDADEDVDAGEDHVGRAGDLEEEGGRVHQRGDGPAGETTETTSGTEDAPGDGASVDAGTPPVEQQQQGERGKVGGGHVGALLEADEDEDDQGGRDTVVTLRGTQGAAVSKRSGGGGAGVGGVEAPPTMSQVKLATQ